MNDAAADLRSTRHDLSQLSKLLDHLLKEIIEFEAGSLGRKRHIGMFFRLLGHKRQLRSEETHARKALLNELSPAFSFAEEPNGEDLDEMICAELESDDWREKELAEIRTENARLADEEQKLKELMNSVGMRPLPMKDRLMPSRPREFHPEPLTDPYVNLSIHTAPAIARKLPPSIETLSSSQQCWLA